MLRIETFVKMPHFISAFSDRIRPSFKVVLPPSQLQFLVAHNPEEN